MPNYHAGWAKIVDKVVIEDESHVSVQLRTPFVRPEALLGVTYEDSDSGSEPLQDGPYWLANQDGEIGTFELNPMYEPVPGRQHPVIVEQRF